jgi:hypothetical protein
MKLSILSTTRSGHNFIKEVIESWVPGIVITVMENTLPENIYQYKLDAHSSRVIVVRDFKNFLASSIKIKADNFGPDGTLRESMEHKLVAYRAILGEALTGHYYDADMIISYDRFCEDQNYRQGICAQLGGTYTEDRLGFVSDEGNGSSFDKFTMQGKGDQMETRSRHEQILKTKWAYIYLELLEENTDLVEKYETLYEQLR